MRSEIRIDHSNPVRITVETQQNPYRLLIRKWMWESDTPENAVEKPVDNPYFPVEMPQNSCGKLLDFSHTSGIGIGSVEKF